jgi:putative ABC transport system substrate-binding protein
MRPREFITLVGGSAAAWPIAARAQQRERMRRVGVLMNVGEGDMEDKNALATFIHALAQFGWSEGVNLHIDVRWAAGEASQFRSYSAELIALNPEVILASSTPAVSPLQQLTRTIPIVFVRVIDPVGSGLVASLARPGGNETGFVIFEYALAAKWLELLKEIAPQITRVAVLRDPTIAAGIGQFAAIQTVAAIGAELSAIDLLKFDDIERSVANFALSPNGGLIFTAGPFGANHPAALAALATKHRLPAVYPQRYYVTEGGLISYGPDSLDQFRKAALYVDRILKDDKPADLPVQATTKYETVLNLKTAKTLGLDVRPSLLARADEVIE